jgi:hypothetical protein
VGNSERTGGGSPPEIPTGIEAGSWHTSGWNIFNALGHVRQFVSTAKTGPLPNGRARQVETRQEIGPSRERIDIETQGDGWALAVENKIDDVERPGQTERYAEHYGRLRKAGIAVFGVFLTRSGESAKTGLFRPAGLRRRLVKTGGRLVKHARYHWLMPAGSHLTRRLFGSMVRRIDAMAAATGRAGEVIRRKISQKLQFGGQQLTLCDKLNPVQELGWKS